MRDDGYALLIEEVTVTYENGENIQEYIERRLRHKYQMIERKADNVIVFRLEEKTTVHRER